MQIWVTRSSVGPYTKSVAPAPDFVSAEFLAKNLALIEVFCIVLSEFITVFSVVRQSLMVWYMLWQSRVDALMLEKDFKVIFKSLS